MSYDWNKTHLYKCEKCGNTTTYLHPLKNTPMCCGQKMRRMD
jgi:desulfoferrodoxin-like iron-binding protein